MPIVIVEYSPKAIALFGDDTKQYKDYILQAGGKFNPSLNYENTRKPGWIFPKSMLETVKKLVEDINNGKLKSIEIFPSAFTPASSTSYAKTDYVDKKAFMAMVSRVELLEQELALLKQQLGLKTPVKLPEPQSVDEEVVDVEDEEEEKTQRPKLLRKTKA